MNRAKFLQEREFIANGNREAADFLDRFSLLLQAADDVVDEPADAEFKISTFQLFNEVYSHPFYLRHVREFSLVVTLFNSSYADAEQAKHSNLKWKQELADVLRHSSAELIRAVAYLCGGWSHLRAMSMKFHEACYYEHHTAEGKPE